MRARRMSTRTIVGAGVALLGLTGVAAATGALPVGPGGPADVAIVAVDSTTSTAVLPDEALETTTTESTTTTDPSTGSIEPPAPEAPGPTTLPDGDDARGPDPTGPAHHGLCTAFGARTEVPGNSVAARNLAAAAAAAGRTAAEFCADVVTPAPPEPAPGHVDDGPESDEGPAAGRVAPPAERGKGRPTSAGAHGAAHGKG